MNSTQNLLDEHSIVRRLGNIVKKCSDGLYSNQNIPIEDYFFCHRKVCRCISSWKGKKRYFPVTKDKNSFSENIQKFLIEHEFGKRIAKMLRRELELLIDYDKYDQSKGLKWNTNKSKEPVARFLKSYSVFVFDHTGKEDVFFKMIQEKHGISDEEDIQFVKHYEICRTKTGGQARIEE
jgi:hemerythrin-like domain-containing protein